MFSVLPPFRTFVTITISQYQRFVYIRVWGSPTSIFGSKPNIGRDVRILRARIFLYKLLKLVTGFAYMQAVAFGTIFGAMPDATPCIGALVRYKRATIHLWIARGWHREIIDKRVFFDP